MTLHIIAGRSTADTTRPMWMVASDQAEGICLCADLAWAERIARLIAAHGLADIPNTIEEITT